MVQVQALQVGQRLPRQECLCPSSPSTPMERESDSSRATTGADATADAISSWISLS